MLSDPKKKARYDSGQDLDDMDNGYGGKFVPSACRPVKWMLKIVVQRMHQ